MKTFVRSAHAELRIEDSGTPGPALMCLHADAADRRMWAPQVEAFRATHRVVVYDRRGFGETHFEPEAFSHEADLIAVLDALRIDRAILMGCAQGGRVAIDAALAHPARVRALVLVACAVGGAPEETAPAAASPGDAPASPSAWERLEQIEAPTLLVWGALDAAPLDALMRALAQRIRGAQSVVVDDAAQLPGLERPDAFNAAVARFLAALDLAPPAAGPAPASE